jgi:Na+-transporting NADH:ubiquinone oxidoreductase subunit NqrA
VVAGESVQVKRASSIPLAPLSGLVKDNKKDVNTKSNGEENFIVFKQLYTGLMVMVVVVVVVVVVVIYQFLKSVVKLEYLLTPRSIRI